MNPIVRARIKTRRELARQGYGPLYDGILQILLKHNPARLDLTRGDARDDYGSPAGTLIPRLADIKESHLEEVLYGEMEHWYRQEAGRPEHYDGIAHEIWQAWMTFQRISD